MYDLAVSRQRTIIIGVYSAEGALVYEDQHLTSSVDNNCCENNQLT